MAQKPIPKTTLSTTGLSLQNSALDYSSPIDANRSA